jgi:predicted MFS family arabinose efflux permease
VLRNPRLKPILTLNFCKYACTFTVQGLWGGPFLREVHGLSPIEAGNVLLVAVIAYQVGMLAFGPLDRLLDTRKWIAIDPISRSAKLFCQGEAGAIGWPPYALRVFWGEF